MKARSVILVTALLLLGNIHCGWARTGPQWLRYGVEWGYSAQFFSAGTCSFFSPNRLFIHDRYYDFGCHSAGLLLLSTGADFCGKWNAALCVGAEGLSKGNTAFPVSGRLTFLPCGTDADGILLFADAGIALKPHSGASDGTFIAKFGGGYRYLLSRGISLDFLCSLQGAMENPHYLNDPYYGVIPQSNVLRSLEGYLAVNFSIALNF